MEVISIERSTYEELLTSFNSFVTKMKKMVSRGNDKGLIDWLDNQDVCQMLNISPRTLQTLRDNGTLAYSLYAAGGHHCFQFLAHRPVVHLAEHQFVFL